MIPVGRRIGFGWGVMAVVGLPGCAPPPGGGTGSALAGQPVVGRIVSVVTWAPPADTIAAFTADDLARLAESGARIVGDPPAIVSAELPLCGHWVEFAGTRTMTDEDGRFTIASLSADAGDGRVFPQFTDTTPEGVFPIDRLRPAAAAPETVVVPLTYVLPDSPQMDGSADAATRGVRTNAPDGCRLRGCAPLNNPVSCCLDFNGTAGDGLDRDRGNDSDGGTDVGSLCKLKANRNFIGSTCYDWVYTVPGRACANEGAVNPVSGGPSCFDNHKYRFCQVMDIAGFSASTARLGLRFGATAKFRIRNATPANETVLRFSESDPGTLAVVRAPGVHATLESLPNGYVLRHYNARYFNHYDDVEIAYTAPDASPAYPCQRTIRLVAEGGGHRREIEIRVGQQIELAPAGATIGVGDSVPFMLRALYADDTTEFLDGATVVWLSSNPGVATVTTGGTVVGVSAGATTLTADHSQCDARATATVVVMPDDDGNPGGPDGSSTIRGEWVGTFSYLDGTAFAWVATFTSTGGAGLSATVVGIEFELGTELPSVAEIRSGPLQGSLRGTQSGNALSFTLSGDWDLTLTGELLDEPEAPGLDLELFGSFLDGSDPELFPPDAPFHGFWSLGFPAN